MISRVPHDFTHDYKQEKMTGQRGKLRALAGICHVHESYFLDERKSRFSGGSLFSETFARSQVLSDTSSAIT